MDVLAPGHETTVQDLFDTLEEWNAGVIKIVPRDESGKALRAVIVVQGVPDTDEILNAIQAVEQSWEEEDDREHRDRQAPPGA